ncbi:hypothetical protein I79_004929 [Cricetulus griseus]|uniref:Uncharacterized protein n=1 Tax=Cricetulus griseus TaxID=10029 RepID=G3H3U2_CRIGR|nr:hypothetical protein I79_004929 [Cricetulus griseus]
MIGSCSSITAQKGSRLHYSQRLQLLEPQRKKWSGSMILISCLLYIVHYENLY